MADKGGKRSLFEGTPYESLGSLGAGGMGKVYLVQHREMHRKFVAKVIHSHLVPDAKSVDRFRLEAQSLGQLAHPHVVSIEGTGTTSDGRPFLVLEYLRGRTLSEEIRAGKIPLQKALSYAEQYLSALEAAHSAGIVHRDLKPGNIFITTSFDGTPEVKVLDFGLAKVLPDAPTDAPSPLADPTTLGNAVGTPYYMSPEQAMGGDVDARGDIYAAAVVLYKTIAGVGPFDEFVGNTKQMKAHVEREPPPPSAHAPVGKELDNVVLRALSKKAEERFATAEDFRLALREAAHHPAGREQMSSARSALTFVAALAAGAVLVLVGQFLLGG